MSKPSGAYASPLAASNKSGGGSYHRKGARGRGPEMAAVPVKSLDALASGDFAKLGPSHLLPLVPLYGRHSVVCRFGFFSPLLPFLVCVRSGVCMMNPTWRDEQHPSFIRFIASFLSANSYRLNFLPISPVNERLTCFPRFRDPEMGFEKIVKIAHARGGNTLTLGDELKCSISSCADFVI
ncbi:hypothetical protein B296_00056250 [Ensete ventricosum]|uniref:Uncharacterized protein n=1 Tax=Ensete ventricosum TaxID=4639 RepID=A0A426X1L1_ENSVE|nr:hypothetical protein B296_00056250 [Ensete ventricosum]